MSHSNFTVSVVIPVYNSVDTLPELAARIHKTAVAQAWEYELIYVDDGSSDKRTWAKLREVCAEYSNALAVQLTRNFGQQQATICGLEFATGDVVITMDDDLQHSPEDVPVLVAAMDEHDIAIAQFPRRRHSVLIRTTSRIKSWFDEIILDKPRYVRLSPFRALSRTVVDGMLTFNSRNPFIPALMFKVSRNVVGVPLSHANRVTGKSGYNLMSRFRVFTNLLINNSSLLLQVIGFLGIALSFASFVFGVKLMVDRLIYNNLVPGWTSVMVTLLFLGGMILFSLGIIGEYLLRIITNVECERSYFVRQIEGGYRR